MIKTNSRATKETANNQVAIFCVLFSCLYCILKCIALYCVALHIAFWLHCKFRAFFFFFGGGILILCCISLQVHCIVLNSTLLQGYSVFAQCFSATVSLFRQLLGRHDKKNSHRVRSSCVFVNEVDGDGRQDGHHLFPRFYHTERDVASHLWLHDCGLKSAAMPM